LLYKLEYTAYFVLYAMTTSFLTLTREYESPKGVGVGEFGGIGVLDGVGKSVGDGVGLMSGGVMGVSGPAALWIKLC
jgi:hypothetical protein